jgi:hypothetical protein
MICLSQQQNWKYKIPAYWSTSLFLVIRLIVLGIAFVSLRVVQILMTF